MFDYNKELKRIGRICKKARKNRNIPVEFIMILTGYSANNVYHFENGDNNNAILLSHYMKFMQVEEINEILFEGDN